MKLQGTKLLRLDGRIATSEATYVAMILYSTSLYMVSSSESPKPAKAYDPN